MTSLVAVTVGIGQDIINSSRIEKQTRESDPNCTYKSGRPGLPRRLHDRYQLKSW